MNTYQTTVNRFDDDIEVEMTVEYEMVEDSDLVPHGEEMVNMDTSEVRIESITYNCNGEPYFPSKVEKKQWEKWIEDKVTDHWRKNL